MRLNLDILSSLTLVNREVHRPPHALDGALHVHLHQGKVIVPFPSGLFAVTFRLGRCDAQLRLAPPLHDALYCAVQPHLRDGFVTVTNVPADVVWEAL